MSLAAALCLRGGPCASRACDGLPAWARSGKACAGRGDSDVPMSACRTATSTGKPSTATPSRNRLVVVADRIRRGPVVRKLGQLVRARSRYKTGHERGRLSESCTCASSLSRPAQLQFGALTETSLWFMLTALALCPKAKAQGRFFFASTALMVLDFGRVITLT